MWKLPVFVLLAGALWAQDTSDLFNKPPIDVDKALRARITQFFELHEKGDFRRAEQLVAEDTKDFFYNTNKPKYLSFEIQKIKYNENFTKADAVVLCEQYVNFPGFEKPMKIPTPSEWKIENGQWVWFVDAEKLRTTPWGKMTAGPNTGGGLDPSKVKIPASADQFTGLVQCDKSEVELKPGGVEHVTIKNLAHGVVSLRVANEIPGIRANLDRSELKEGGQVVLSITALDNVESGSLRVLTVPPGPALTIAVKAKK